MRNDIEELFCIIIIDEESIREEGLTIEESSDNRETDDFDMLYASL